MFLNISVLQGGVVSTSPNPQPGGPPLVGCPRLLIQFIRSYPPYRRPFPYPQPEDAPCRDDRDPLNGTVLLYFSEFSSLIEAKTLLYALISYDLVDQGILKQENPSVNFICLNYFGYVYVVFLACVAMINLLEPELFF